MVALPAQFSFLKNVQLVKPQLVLISNPLIAVTHARSRRLSFGLPRFRLPSTVICNIFLVASSLSRLCTCPNHLSLCHRVHVCLFPDVYISHMIQSHLSSCLSQHPRFSCVQFPLLLLSICPTFFSVHHGRLYTLSLNFVGMFLSRRILCNTSEGRYKQEDQLVM